MRKWSASVTIDMASFNYFAMKADNSYVKGQITAWSMNSAIRRIEREGNLVVNMKRTAGRDWKNIVIFSTVSRQDRIYLLRHLHSFLDAGISLNQAVKIASDQVSNPKLKKILVEAHADISAGQRLSAALRKHERYFFPYFLNLIKVGEESGTLDKTLEHLLEQQEREYELISNIRGAMIYPALIILAAIAVVVFMMIFVVPTVAGVLKENGGELPLATRILIGISDFFVAYWLFLIPASLALVIAFRFAVKTEHGKRIFESFLLKVPFISRVAREYNLARFARSLSAPLLSGLSIVRALEMTSDAVTNYHYQTALKRSSRFVSKGIPLSETLSGYPGLFPPNVLGMVEIGERTGRVDTMLIKLANFYEKSVFDTFKNITSVVEPFLLIFIGLVVGFIAVSILTPIWKFAETI